MPDGRRLRHMRLLVLPALVFALISSLGIAGTRQLWASYAGASGTGVYRYHFERPARGSVRRALEEEIAFLQVRMNRNPGGGLDLAVLAATYLKMAKATGDLKWYLLAEQAAQRSLANLPYQNRGALLALARVAEARHDFSEAIHLARLAGNGSESLSILVTSNLARGNLNEAARAAEAVVASAPGLGSYTLRALVDEARGNDDAALADYARAIMAEEPGEAGSSAWARTLLGRLHYRRGRLEMAHELYQEALRILPQYPLALLNLAELEMREGKYRAAEQHLTGVVTITRASPNVYDHVVPRGLARLQELQGDPHRAAVWWEEAEARLRRDVTSGQFGHRRELARLLLERGRPQDTAEALSLMNAEVQVREDADTLGVYAWALARAGRWAGAEAVIFSAMRSGVRDARLFYRASTIEQALGHLQEARRFLDLMQQTDPRLDEQARRILGVIP